MRGVKVEPAKWMVIKHDSLKITSGIYVLVVFE